MRDEFTDNTKRLIAERVAYRCSYPGCDVATVAASSAAHQRTLVGQAAHIAGATANGPRFDPSMTSEQRRSAANGIWMCNNHGRQIDVDEGAFSAATLLEWKADAERRSLARLGKPITAEAPSTLVALGFNHVLRAAWIGASPSAWRFRVLEFIRGDERSLMDAFATLPPEFVVVGSQGDGRLLSAAPSWSRQAESLELEIPVAAREPLTSPGQGWDLRLVDGDLACGPDGLATVQGIEADIQELEIRLGTVLGSWALGPLLGSLVALYYRDHRHDRQLLASLVQLELARLSTIPLGTLELSPTTQVWRVDRVVIPTVDLEDGYLPIVVDLTWSDQTRWTGTLRVAVDEDLDGLLHPLIAHPTPGKSLMSSSEDDLDRNAETLARDRLTSMGRSPK